MVVEIALLQPEARYQLNLTLQPRGNDSLGRFSVPSLELPLNRSTFLTDHDQRRFAWAISQVRKIVQTPPLSEHILNEVYPHMANLEKYLDQYHYFNSNWSGGGTMGDGELAVVDEYLNVYGVDRLRIVGRAVFPTVPVSGNHAATKVLARRADGL